jgi:hypothetical protein
MSNCCTKKNYEPIKKKIRKVTNNLIKILDKKYKKQ